MDSIFIRLQEVASKIFVEFKPDSGAAIGEVLFELLSNHGLDSFCRPGIAAANLPNCCGYHNPLASRNEYARLTAKQIFHSRRSYPPLCNKTVGRKTGVQRAGRAAVQIGQVATYDGAEPRNVETRVLELQRVKRPFDQINASNGRVSALFKLEKTPDSAILILL